MSAWWYLGEAVNWLHVMILPGMIVLGWLWMRPIWLWPIFAFGVPISWKIFGHGECIVTIFSNWLQSTDYYSFFQSFPATYGHFWGGLIIAGLVFLSIGMAIVFRRPLRDGTDVLDRIGN